MAIQESKLSEAKTEEFYRDLDRLSMGPLWRRRTLIPEPTTPVKPFVWRWREFYPMLLRATEVMRPEDDADHGPAERRALHLLNPGMKDLYSATNTIVASIQIILPGEIAPAHRHTPHAIRFMIQGAGAYSTVDGEKTFMQPGDLILTPNWTWHDHGNVSDKPIVWMDGLDRVLVQQLNAVFFEQHPVGKQEQAKPDDYSVRRYGATSVRPMWDHLSLSPASSPQIRYTWTETQAALRRLAELGERSPRDEIAVAYVNPETGGYPMSTLGCAAQMLPPSSRTKAYRRTGSAVYTVVSGQGHSIVNGLRFSWEKGDCFTLPPWAWFEHVNASQSQEAFLFCLNDLPTFHALNLYREQDLEANNGHQQVTGELNGSGA